MEDPHPQAQHFSIARGGPLFSLMKRLGLAARNDLRNKSRALAFVLLTWVVPLALSAMRGHLVSIPGGVAYLSDAGVWAKFLLATGLFIVSERGIDRKLASCVGRLLFVPIIPKQSLAVANQAITRATARRDSSLPELICLLLAIALSVLNYWNLLHQPGASWAIEGQGDGLARLTPAGWWTLCISNTIFWFVLLRIFWWHANWTLLARDLARLPLRIVATHPDGYGGIGFVNDYPNGYIVFNIGLSCVVAAAVAREPNLTATAFGVIAGLWLAMALVFFMVPLLWFGGRLAKLKRRTLSEASARATEFERQAERKVFGRNLFADGDEVRQEPVADPGKFYSASIKRPSLIAARKTMIPIIAASLLPLAALGATEFPFGQLMTIIKRLLFL